MNRQKKKTDIICRCNNISRETIEAAIRGGCRTMNDIFDETTAGVGPCGGSCRRRIVPILQTYLETGEFPPPTSPSKHSPSENLHSDNSPSKKTPSKDQLSENSTNSPEENPQDKAPNNTGQKDPSRTWCPLDPLAA